MILINEIYDILGYQRPGDFCREREAKNIEMIKKGDMECSELFRQTGRTTFIQIAALSLTSMNKTVAIKVSNTRMKKHIEMYLKNYAMILLKNFGIDMFDQNMNIRNIFCYVNDIDLIGRGNIDIYLNDTFEKDLKMIRKGFYV